MSARAISTACIGLALAWLLVVAASASADTLYGADGAQGNNSNLDILNPANGAVISTVGPIGFPVTGLALHPLTGVLYGSTSNNAPVGVAGNLIRIDRTTGRGTLVGSFGFPGQQTMADLTFTGDGTLYGWLEPHDDSLATIDLTTGAATVVASSGVTTFGSGLAASGCNMIFVAGSRDNGPLRVVNRRTGQPIVVSTLNGTLNSSIGALTFDGSGTLFGVVIDTSVSSQPAHSFLVTIAPGTGAVTTLGQTVNRLDAIVFDTGASANLPIVAAVLPGSRSVQVGEPATAFVTIINAGAATAHGVCLSVDSAIPVTFTFQTTDPLTNLPTGTANTPVDIGAGQSQSFVISLTPTSTFSPTDVSFVYGGANTALASTVTGLDTLLLSASSAPVPDIVALAATANNDGIVNLPGANGSGAFAVATSNVGGAGDNFTVVADTGGVSVPVTIVLCRTDPSSGLCISATGSSVPVTINAGETPTFAIFVNGGGVVNFDPAVNRIFVRFKDAGNITRGATSVAVRTQ